MELSTIIILVTALVTHVFGLIAKKVEWFDNKLIPLQNLAIGIIVAIIEYIITKDFNVSIAVAGLGTGGAYDLVHNIAKLLENTENTDN